MSETVRALLVGCGGISRAWLRALQDMPAVQIVGLVDIIEANARARADEFGLQGALIETNLAKALEALGPQVVFNCTIPEAHREVTLTALAHGCHVLGEKPLADSMAHAREMVSAAQAAGKLFAVIQNRRYDPNIRRFRHLIASGALGPLTTLNSDFYLGAHFGGFRDRMAHVLLLDMAIHTFDQARLISGADPMSVYCHEWNPPGSWYDHDATAVAVFEMSGGLIYTYRGSWCAEGLNTTWEADWRAIGVEGSATWDGAEGFVAETVQARGGFRSELAPLEVPAHDPGPKVGGHAGVIREFVRCVQHGGVPETAAADNIHSLAMVFGAIESAERGERVRIKV
ncbi:MAG: Gfo/Idh/MocA family oxidoreductase [Anaerolineae bacterium]|nr:Gfo/Idh/MocA family oxidoreductase [Anaerolineae bacterium]